MTPVRWIAIAIIVWAVPVWWHGLYSWERSTIKWHLYRRWRLMVKLALHRRRMRRQFPALYDWNKTNDFRKES